MRTYREILSHGNAGDEKRDDTLGMTRVEGRERGGCN
jgi:hypothetical protein